MRTRTPLAEVLACSIWFRIDFKVLLLVFKALNGHAPSYIADLLTPYSTARTLRSSNSGLLVVPQPKLKSRGDRAFAVAAPTLWNSIPLSIRSAPLFTPSSLGSNPTFILKHFGSSCSELIICILAFCVYRC